MEKPALIRIISVLAVLVVFLACGLFILGTNLFSADSPRVLGESTAVDNSNVQDDSVLPDSSTDPAQSFLEAYHGMKYPAVSGIRRFVGEEPLRIYPNRNAPYVVYPYGGYKPEVVEVVNVVSVVPFLGSTENEQRIWSLILDSNSGLSGYARCADLIAVDPKDEIYGRDFGHGLETLGGFKAGDRIETLIGRLDRDYYLIYENGRIYEFPDSGYDASVEPMDVPFKGADSLDAFVWYTNHVSLLRTDSPEFPLQDGYKVGDNAAEVLDFYEMKYDCFTGDPTHYEYSPYTFVLEEGHHLQFRIDTDELTPNSVVTSIWID